MSKPYINIPVGAQGPQGATGPYGSGPQGITGASGVGATGLQGATGLSGLGTTGIQGTTGAQGTAGSAGATGISGLTGAQGTPGSQGVTGLIGFTGIQGATGVPGIGTAGAQGDTGVAGTPGQTGAQGVTGPSGGGGEGTTISTWATATSYPVDSLVIYIGMFFRCTTNHTSASTFADDLGNWLVVGSNEAFVSATAQLFTAFTPVYSNAGVWTAAVASASTTLATHIVLVASSTYALLATSGTYGITTGLSDGTYWLSQSSAGTTVTSAPVSGYANQCYVVSGTGSIINVTAYLPVEYRQSFTGPNDYVLLGKVTHDGSVAMGYSMPYDAEVYPYVRCAIVLAGTDTTGANASTRYFMVYPNGDTTAGNYQVAKMLAGRTGASADSVTGSVVTSIGATSMPFVGGITNNTYLTMEGFLKNNGKYRTWNINGMVVGNDSVESDNCYAAQFSYMWRNTASYISSLYFYMDSGASVSVTVWGMKND